MKVYVAFRCCSVLKKAFDTPEKADSFTKQHPKFSYRIEELTIE